MILFHNELNEELVGGLSTNQTAIWKGSHNPILIGDLTDHHGFLNHSNESWDDPPTLGS